MKSIVKLALGDLVVYTSRRGEKVGKVIATIDRPNTCRVYLVELNNYKTGHDGRGIKEFERRGATVHLLPNVSFEASDRRDRSYFNDWDIRKGTLKPYKLDVVDGGLL